MKHRELFVICVNSETGEHIAFEGDPRKHGRGWTEDAAIAAWVRQHGDHDVVMVKPAEQGSPVPNDEETSGE